MVEKIIVNPLEVRCLGNISLPKGLEDYERYQSSLMEGTSLIGGAVMAVKSLVYNADGFMFFFSESVKQLHVSDDGELVDSFTFTDKSLCLSSSEGVSLSFDENNKELIVNL